MTTIIRNFPHSSGVKKAAKSAQELKEIEDFTFKHYTLFWENFFRGIVCRSVQEGYARCNYEGCSFVHAANIESTPLPICTSPKCPGTKKFPCFLVHDGETSTQYESRTGKIHPTLFLSAFVSLCNEKRQKQAAHRLVLEEHKQNADKKAVEKEKEINTNNFRKLLERQKHLEEGTVDPTAGQILSVRGDLPFIYFVNKFVDGSEIFVDPKKPKSDPETKFALTPELRKEIVSYVIYARTEEKREPNCSSLTALVAEMESARRRIEESKVSAMISAFDSLQVGSTSEPPDVLMGDSTSNDNEDDNMLGITIIWERNSYGQPSRWENI